MGIFDSADSRFSIWESFEQVFGNRIGTHKSLAPPGWYPYDAHIPFLIKDPLFYQDSNPNINITVI